MLARENSLLPSMQEKTPDGAKRGVSVFVSPDMYDSTIRCVVAQSLTALLVSAS